MSYQQNYQYGQYAGYQGYGQPQQTYQTSPIQYQHPMVVIPVQQPRGNVPSSQSSPVHYQNLSQPSVYQQSPSQYYTAPQQQQQNQSQPVYYPLQYPQQYGAQVFQQQTAQYTQQQTYQQPPQLRQTQPNYVQPVRQFSPQQSPQLAYQPAPRQPLQSSPLLSSHVLSSPDQLSGPATVGRMPVSQSTQYQQPLVQAPRPQQRSNHQQMRTPSTSTPPQPPPQQRVLTAVEIPSYQHEMAPAPKRRRSNEGRTIAVNGPAPSQRASQKHAKPAPAAISSSPLTELNSSQLPPTPQPSVDYQAILLSAAEEYVNAAYGMSAAIATGSAPEKQHEEYCALIAAAMACLESVLNNYRPTDPRKEARIRLRLATLLVDECDNSEEAEAILGKGIALCDTNRLPDLKYAMQHLSVRLTFKSSPKAALRAIDKLVHEAENLRLGHWQYAFRLLRVSLSLQLGAQSEVAATVKHLNALDSVADERRHIAVQLVTATLETIVHLRSTSPDAMDSATRAMAAARTHQLGPEMQAMQQIRGLLDCLDIACSLTSFKKDQAAAKMQRLQQVLDDRTFDSGWSKDGSFTLELGPCKNPDIERDTGGIMQMTEGGQVVLVMRWLTKSQLYALSFALSVFTMVYKSPTDTKVDAFMAEGLKMVKTVPDPGRRALGVAAMQVDQQQALSVVMRLYRAWAFCSRFEWEHARKAINNIHKEAKGIDYDDDTARSLIYMQAVCRQGQGHLQEALDMFTSPDLAWLQDSKASSTEKDLRALATLNSIFILRSQGHDGYARAASLQAQIEHYCLTHTNKAMSAALNIIKATSQEGIVKTKQYMHMAVTASKEVSNNLLMAIVMNVMTSRFFSQLIVGDQAEKSAHAARTLAKQGRNRLWTAVADGMYGDIKERCGKLQEAEAARKEGAMLAVDLPLPLMEQVRKEEVPAPTAGGHADAAPSYDWP